VTARIPRATYRVQLHKDFGFAAARERVPYWAALGISHLYTSPLLRARPGRAHGYDVVDHGMLNPELGSRADFDALVAKLREHRMGLLVDVVPNHMGVLGGDNAWWLDVLENGAASAYANHFDIDWASADPALHARVLLPILGDQYGIVLEAGELRLGFDAARGYFTIDYHEHQLPIDPTHYGGLLRRALPALDSDGAAALDPLLLAFEQLPARDDAVRQGERQRDKSALKARLAALCALHAGLADRIHAGLLPLNGRVSQRSSFDALDALIDAQPYRLAHWRVAGDQINYRRFFDINELAALRMERAEVFDDTHRLLLELCAAGAIDGLRIDHPDGLADPAAYFARLQQAYAQRAGTTGDALPLYVVAEKIVAPHEQVPADWMLHGTTGYRFANLVNGLFVDGRAKARLDRAWRAFAGDEAQSFDTLAEHGRKLVMAGALAGEMGVLAAALLRWRSRGCASNRAARRPTA
jgi:(1->4)-alpha-D-glucan 1-alpha-D-glucosylmutase